MYADLKNFLLADSTISGLVGTRVYPVKLPQNPTTPAIVVTLISGNSVVTNDGPSGLSGDRIQVDCWAKTQIKAIELYNAVRLRLNGASVGIFQGIFLVAKRDMYDNDAKLSRRSADYAVWNEEST